MTTAELPPAYAPPSYHARHLVISHTPILSTTTPSRIPTSSEVNARSSTGASNQSGEATLSRSTQNRTSMEHTYHLYNNTGKPWATLKLHSRAFSAKLLPAYYEGDPIAGAFQLNLEREDKIKTISITVTGRLINTVTTGHDSFLRVEQVLWSSLMDDPSGPGSSNSNESSGKFLGTYSWPFSIELPKDIRIAGKAGSPGQVHGLPPTFQDRNVHCTVQYNILVHIHRSRLRADNKLGTPFGYLPFLQPKPASMLRQVSYQENCPLIGVDGDPEGWTALDAVRVLGNVFNTRSVGAICKLSIANPLCYTRGTAIPCIMVIQTNDTQALDLLSSPKAPIVQLKRKVGFQADNSGDKDIRSSDIAVNVTSDTCIETAIWWPSTEGYNAEPNVRRLDGEIHLPPHMTPSCTFPGFVLTYSVVMYPFQAAGFQSALEEPLTTTKVEIVTAYPRGPRPRRYAPPSYMSGSTRPLGVPVRAFQ